MTASVQWYYNPKDPSEYRRKALMGGDDEGNGASVMPVVSSFFPIERYFEAAVKVLDAFEEAMRKNDLDSAFVYGKRYCTFCIKAIPKHNYYNLPKHAGQRKKIQDNVGTILEFLEDIKKKFDVEETTKYKRWLERQRVEAEKKEKERQRQLKLQQEREHQKYQELLRRAESAKQHSKSPTTVADGGNVEASAMNKLQLLLGQPSPSSTESDKSSSKRPSGRFYLSDTDEEEDASPTNGKKQPSVEIGQPMPPPMPPPNYESTGSLPPPPGTSTLESPPPYDFATTSNRRNPFLGSSDAPYALPPPVSAWGDVRPPSYQSLPDPPTRRYPAPSQERPTVDRPPTKRQKKIPVRQLKNKALKEFNNLLDQGRIEIRPIDTYQGRYTESTNACTVISPLVVARHMRTSSGVVLSDREIKEVIDKQCCPLVRDIRRKLGLTGYSLIIPSDVHDHLVDEKILKQEEFIGATGGNIISEEQIEEFLKLFREKIKAGAALFFKEHVISIIKIPAGGSGRAFYDLVDSMPGQNGKASRIRCKDEDALRVLLLWYATKKFHDSNCSYIDNNDWDDNMADLDPRVFQVFVWGKDP